jgi:alkanesulfonate monooxygenase SsuD/methylene tetrahydromethanopterin reductase-like flavin-dependent oxidoreductase (luciferase family)
MVEWARRAEQRGFESVTTIDRLVYPSIDSIIALALAAGATTGLALVSNILLAPLYPPAILAKQLASLALAVGDRIAIGVGVGARDDDYTAAGVDFSKRGRVLDEIATTMQEAWRGAPIADGSPLSFEPVHIPLLFGGRSKATLRRATTIGDGWVAGALRDYKWQGEFLEEVRKGWQEAGRTGEPASRKTIRQSTLRSATNRWLILVATTWRSTTASNPTTPGSISTTSSPHRRMRAAPCRPTASWVSTDCSSIRRWRHSNR